MAQSFTGKKRIRKSFGRIPEAVQHAEPDRGSALFLRTVPAARGPPGAAARRGYRGGVPLGLPDQGFQRARHARIRLLRVRGARIRRRGVHPARHDLCGAAEGQAAPDRLGNRRGNPGPFGQGYQGTGCLHGRHPADDRQGHLCRERHRAGHRLARCTVRPASSSITTRARPTPPASCCSPPGSSLTAAPGSTSNSTPRTLSSCASTARRKLPATTFLYALGMDGEEILTTFYDVVPFEKRDPAAGRRPTSPSAGAA